MNAPIPQPTQPTLLIPDYVIAAIEGYGLARASIEGSYTNAAVALTEVFAQLRHWGAHLQAPLLVVDAPTPRPPPDAMTLLKAARHALRSYGFGNSSPDLGAGIASDIEQFLNRQAEAKPVAVADAAPVAEGVALDMLDAAPLAPLSPLEATVLEARDIAEDAELSVATRAWQRGAHTPDKRLNAIFQRRYYPGGAVYLCRWDGRIWWSADASKPGVDPDGWLNGGVSHYQHLDWRGPLTQSDLDETWGAAP